MCAMRIFSLCLLAALCVFSVRVPAMAVPYGPDEPTGSYQNSCVSIQMQGGNLYANCQDVNGRWHNAQLNMDQCPGGPVANNNGTLVCGPGGYGISNSMPRGSWRASCRNATQDGTMLYAQCDNGASGWNDTSMDLNDCPSQVVDNSRGYLVCRNGGGFGFRGVPPGSWRYSCRNASMEGPVIFAECNTGRGGWQQSSFDTNQCPGGSLGNVHGNLACEAAYRDPRFF